MKHYISIIIVTLFAASLIGCGNDGRPADLPRLTSVELTVQYEDGSPIPDALVMLYPFEGKWYSNGQTNSSGSVKPLVDGKYAGVVPGDYKVTVKKQNTVFPAGYDPNSEKEQPEPTITNLVDTKYAVPASSPLKLTVGSSSVSETVKVKKPK
ncbi:MAG: carboxypeptidase-like regulatory domain-containing protein [Planctomycetaceae bacterium]|jgi:hypothetical protein|nr:carboxypeptidase-like regulatory domain-containing protein [Planctomycetaceae bacterium]